MNIVKSHKWHPNFLDVCDRANTDGVTKPSYDVLVGINGLIRQHVRSGLWAVTDAYYNFRHDGDEAFGYYNLKRPAETILSKVGTTTFVNNSYVEFAGTSGYYRTNVVLDQYDFYDRLANSIHFGMSTGTLGPMLGKSNAASGYIFFSQGNIRHQTAAGSGVVPSGGNWVEGNFSVARVDTSNIKLNKNGVNDGNLAQANSWVSADTADIWLGTRNADGVATDGTAARMKYYSFGGFTNDTIDLATHNAEAWFEAYLATL